MDQGLNGLNRISDRFFVGGLARGLSDFGRDAPARMVLWILAPFWTLMGVDGEGRERKMAAISQALRSGTLPVGISVAATVFFLALEFVLR
jgi:hypothetical protein